MKPWRSPNRFHFGTEEQSPWNLAWLRVVIYTQICMWWVPRRAPMVTLGPLQVLQFQKAFHVPPWGLRCGALPPCHIHSGIPAPSPWGDSNLNISEALWIFKGERFLTSGEKKEILTQQQTCWGLQNGRGARAFHGRASVRSLGRGTKPVYFLKKHFTYREKKIGEWIADWSILVRGISCPVLQF